MKSKADFIQSLSGGYPTNKLCKLMNIPRNTLYHLIQRTTKHLGLRSRIKTVFDSHMNRYGSRRIKKELAVKYSENVSRHLIRKCMKDQNLKAIQPKSFVPKTTDSTGTKFPSPNLLIDFGKAQKPNEIWVGDITYIPLKNGQWAYLSTWIDTYLHKVVGWDVQTHMRSELVVSAFNKAKLKSNQKNLNVIIHSDRGTQYSSKEFRKAINGNRQSMTRKNEVYDNAIAESFFSRLKCECIRGKVFNTLDQLRSTLFEYIECYYNTIRRHSSIQYYTPLEFENIYYSKNQLTNSN